MEKAKSTCDLFSLAVIVDLKPKSFWMCLPSSALMLLILIILVTNSFQSIERLMKRSMGILYRSIVHYKAHCLCNLAASIFPNKQKSQRRQLLKPACGLLMRNLNCMKAIRMLLFQAIGLLMCWVLPRLLWGICSPGLVSVPTASNLGDRSWWQVVSAVSDASLQPICWRSPPSLASPVLQGKCIWAEGCILLQLLWHMEGMEKLQRWFRAKIKPQGGNGKRALSHLIKRFEETSNASFCSPSTGGECVALTALLWPSGWSCGWSVLQLSSKAGS